MTHATAAVLRLRPIVHASPAPDGVHVRGARSSFTMNGAPGLWRLWQAVAVALAAGSPRAGLLALAPNPTVRTAVATLLKQLDEHDMLVEVPPGWGESFDAASPPARIASWLASIAPDPVVAWERLRSARVVVLGAGPVAAAASRALTGAGVTVVGADATTNQDTVVLAVGEVSVAAASGGDTGFVTPAGTAESARRDAEAIAARIGLRAGDPAPVVLAALVGGAAAHRLVCAVAGLPDPGADDFAAAPAADHDYPTALIARLDPLRAEYHPWLASAATVPPSGGPTGLDAALMAVTALSDPETGVLPVVNADELPQSPAGLAGCAIGDVVVCGIGTDSRTARLNAALGTAEHLLALGGGAPAVVGADTRHAEGVLLRRLVHRRYGRLPAGTEDWARSAVARRWFKTVTLRFGVKADLRVNRLAAGVYCAELYDGSEQLGWAVEATPADAAAFCALTAAGTLQWRAAGGDPATVVHAPCGASPQPAPQPVTDTSGSGAHWQTDAWTWPAAAYQTEDSLQEELRQLLGTHALPTEPLLTERHLRRVLAAAGLVTLEAAP